METYKDRVRIAQGIEQAKYIEKVCAFLKDILIGRFFGGFFGLADTVTPEPFITYKFKGTCMKVTGLKLSDTDKGIYYIAIIPEKDLVREWPNEKEKS